MDVSFKSGPQDEVQIKYGIRATAMTVAPVFHIEIGAMIMTASPIPYMNFNLRFKSGRGNHGCLETAMGVFWTVVVVF